MKKVMILLLSAILIVLCPLSVFAEEAPIKQVQSELAPEEEQVKSKSAVLMSMDTGEVLYAKNETDHLSPASVTKIMTILLILEALEDNKITLSDTVSASSEAVSMGGSQIWLEEGETMTVEELLKAVVVASANDACTALAEYVGGSVTGFVKMMNDRAGELGLTNTHFENCNGLDDTVTNHYSCAYDLAVISAEVMKHQIITDYTGIWLDSLRNGETELNNTNKLVNTYNGITGLKTGTTSLAGFCISATACRDDMNLVAVVLGAETSDDRFDTATYLLDWGFANYQVITPEIDENQIGDVKVNLGEKKTVKPVIDGSNKILLQKGKSDLDYQYQVNESVNAPVTKGDKLGEIVISSDSEPIKTITLVSDEDILKVSVKTIFFHTIQNI